MPDYLTTNAPPWPTQRCAYQLAKAEMDAISADRLVGVDVDIPIVAQVVLGRMPRILALRSAVASSLADFDMRAIDRLELYVRSMTYAHWLYQSTRVSIDRLREWLEQWPPAHDRLVAEASRLLSSHVLDRSCFDDCPNPRRCLDGMTGAQRLCCLFNLNWRRIECVTSIRWEEIAHAEVVAELASIVAEHNDDLQEAEAVLTLNRQRAFALFLTNYDQVRRVTQFIRWGEGDVDDIAPALRRQVTRRRLDSCPPPISTQFAIEASVNVTSLIGNEKKETG
jgi:hypothetical protein